jgi:Uma2 family endonuclease
MTQLLDLSTDQRIVHQGHTWEQFKLIQQGFAGFSGVRLGYYKGTIEILMPGREHEIFKGIIGLLIEMFLYEKRVEFEQTGSMTQEEAEVASAQADESYCIGASKPIPDLSIEVVFTSGSTAKLTQYQALGVPEVWFWEDGLFTLHRLREQGYDRISRSEIPELADLDIDLLTQCVLMAQTSRLPAIDQFRQGTR